MGGFSIPRKDIPETIVETQPNNTINNGTKGIGSWISRIMSGNNAAVTSNTNEDASANDDGYKSNGFLFHPELNFKDKMLAVIIRTMLPYQKVYKSPISRPISDDSMKGVRAFRDAINKNTTDYEICINKMKDEYHWDHIQTTLSRDPNILFNWNIIDKNEKKPANVVDDVVDEVKNGSPGTVSVLIYGPSDLLDTEHCAMKVDEMKRRSVPILIHFHGGGMIAGRAADSWPLSFAEQMLKCHSNDNIEQPSKELMIISVDYGLSAEHIFPYAVVDGLSVMEYLLRTFSSNCQLHIAGVSAGGNLAAVTTMETIRYAPGRLQSSFIMHPMLDPMANTKTYHTNDYGSMLSSRWMHWCWKAYLGVDFDNTNNSTIKNCKNTCHAQIMKEKCTWLNTDHLSQSNVWQRLINPAIDLPSKDSMSKTKILITAAKGDILFQEGHDFAQSCLKRQMEDGDTTALTVNLEISGTASMENDSNSGHVKYIETSGDHALALETNPQMKDSIIKEWSRSIFG